MLTNESDLLISHNMCQSSLPCWNKGIRPGVLDCCQAFHAVLPSDGRFRCLQLIVSTKKLH